VKKPFSRKELITVVTDSASQGERSLDSPFIVSVHKYSLFLVESFYSLLLELR
jgi:hypothetical protein